MLAVALFRGFDERPAVTLLKCPGGRSFSLSDGERGEACLPLCQGVISYNYFWQASQALVPPCSGG